MKLLIKANKKDLVNIIVNSKSTPKRYGLIIVLIAIFFFINSNKFSVILLIIILDKVGFVKSAMCLNNIQLPIQNFSLEGIVVLLKLFFICLLIFQVL